MFRVWGEWEFRIWGVGSVVAVKLGWFRGFRILGGWVGLLG